jgi:hypothetical protein
MAKKSSGAIGGASSTSPQSKKLAEKSGTRVTRLSETRQKTSSLLNTRVIYCGDNLEQLANPCKFPQGCHSALSIAHAVGSHNEIIAGILFQARGNLRVSSIPK